MYRSILLVSLIFLTLVSIANADAPPIQIVDSETPTQEIGRIPGNIYVGQEITFEDTHAGDNCDQSRIMGG